MKFEEEIKFEYSNPKLYNAEFGDYLDDIYFWEIIVREYDWFIILNRHLSI